MSIAAQTAARTTGKHDGEPWYSAILEFAGHVVGGTTIFLLIGGAGWLLHRATALIGKETPLLFYGLEIAEALVFSADTCLYVLFVARTFWRAARKLVKTWND